MRRDQFGVARAPALNLPPEYRALAAALTPPHELREDWRARLRQIVESAKNDIQSSDEKLRLQVAADMAEWFLCAKSGEPLPDTLILEQGKDEYVYLTGVYTELYELPDDVKPQLKPLWEERARFFKQQEATILSAFVRVIRVSPQYRALKALTLPAPRHTQTRPLRDREIAQRLAQEQAHVLASLGLTDADMVIPGSLPDQLLRAIPGRLEMETVPDLRRDTPTRAKVNAWFLNQAQDWRSEDPDDKIVGLFVHVDRDPHGDVAELMARTATGQTLAVDDKALGWSQDFYEKSGTSLILGDLEPGIYLAYFFARQFFLDTNRDPAIALRRAVEEESRNALEEMSPRDLYDRAAFLLREVPNAIHLPHSDYSLSGSTLPAPGRARVRLVPNAERKQSFEETTGVVLHRSDGNDVSRLITAAATAGQYPPLGSQLPEYDLVIEFTDAALSSTGEPYIPGFDVVAATANRWAFQRGDDDPYDRSSDELSLDPDRAAELIGVYRDIGLHGLGEAVAKFYAQRGQISAFDLERMIAQHSSYPLPEYAPPDDPGQPESPPLEWFARHVHGGRLHAQCTGAALFCAASIQRALPGCSASTVTGLVLGSEDQITGIGHAQTAITQHGRLHLLDATAPAPPGFGLTDNELRRSPNRQVPRRGKKTPNIAPPVVNRAAAEAERVAAQAAAIPQQVEQIICGCYGAASRDEALRRVTALKATDPIRRALAAARNPGRNNVAEVVASLDRYVAHDPRVRARAASETGISDAPELVALLADCLRPLIPAASPPSQPSHTTPSTAATVRTRLDLLRRTFGRLRH